MKKIITYIALILMAGCVLMEGQRVRHVPSGMSGLVIADSKDNEAQILFDEYILSSFVPAGGIELE